MLPDQAERDEAIPGPFRYNVAPLESEPTFSVRMLWGPMQRPSLPRSVLFSLASGPSYQRAKWQMCFGRPNLVVFFLRLLSNDHKSTCIFFGRWSSAEARVPVEPKMVLTSTVADSATVMDPIALRTWPVDIKQADFLIKFQVTLRMQGTSLVGRGWQEVRMCVATSHRSILP